MFLKSLFETREAHPIMCFREKNNGGSKRLNQALYLYL